jgi:glycine/D-amino acid oxidase-like deaminating enzyme
MLFERNAIPVIISSYLPAAALLTPAAALPDNPPVVELVFAAIGFISSGNVFAGASGTLFADAAEIHLLSLWELLYTVPARRYWQSAL